MRKVLKLLCLAFFCAALAACGGGGGGGGGINTDSSTIYYAGFVGLHDADSQGVQLSASEIFNYTPPDGRLAGAADDTRIVKTADGITIYDYDSPPDDNEYRSRTLNFASDFHDGQDYITAVSVENIPNGQENHAYTDAIFLGGKKLGLKYSEFGAWKNRFHVTGISDEGKNLDITDSDYHLAFHAGDSSKEKAFSVGSGTYTFSGNALGQAFDDDQDTLPTAHVFGEARLTVNTTGAIKADLELDFTDFCKITLSGFTPNSSSYTTAVTAVANGENKTGVDLVGGTSLEAYITSKFYGASAVEEGVGDFTIYYDTSDARGVTGVFGVKRLPPP